MKHFKYLGYVIRHKWYVMVECFKMGLIWRGLVHDLSKFLSSEWFPYVDSFYGDYPDINKVSAGFKYAYTGRYKSDIRAVFDYAWLLHQKHNPHHWQYWVLIQDQDNDKILRMPEKYAKEMLCDWIGAGKAQGYKAPDECSKWYEKNKVKMKLHPDTRKWIEAKLKIKEINDEL